MNPLLRWCCSSTLVLCFCLLIPATAEGTTFTFVNRCNYTVWPGIRTLKSRINTTGFVLHSESSRSFQAEPEWNGQIWARTGCNFNWTGFGSCLTGDCGSGLVECNGGAWSPPVTLAEIAINVFEDLDFYDTSLAVGFNVPIKIEARGGSGSCSSTGCIADLNRFCPPELVYGDGEGCMSPCQAFGRAEYCCTNAYGEQELCNRPNVYSELFGAACPSSYVTPVGGGTPGVDPTFTCRGAADYVITFCPSSGFSF